MASRESDVALWLHNKLGSTDDLWSGKSICSQLTQERLLHIQECFPNLQPHVKVKLLLSFMHLPRRNIEEWKVDIEELVDMAINDGDQWVSTVADILKAYPSSGGINKDVDENNTAFHEVLMDLRKVVKKVPDMSTTTLPLECQYINRSSHNAMIGQQPIPPKHFALKRKPKSAALRAEILQKSVEAANNTNKKTNSCPIKSRSFAKRMDNTPMKSFGARSNMFRSPSTPSNRSSPFHGSGPFGQRTPHSNIKKEGGIKLLDITEQPVGLKEAKRRRRQADMEAMELAKKERSEQQSAVNTTPDYAAGLMSPAPSMINNPSTPQSTSTPSYAPPSSSRLPTTANVSGPLPTVTASPSKVSQNTQSARENLQEQLRQQLDQSQIRTQQPMLSTNTTPSTPNIPAPSVIPVPNPAAVLTPASAEPPPPPSNPNQSKRGLSLTKEQMMDAQEMFRTSNKVTRPEKALILGFMAGSRENPCPQHGDIVNIRLSEDSQKIVMEDSTVKEMTVDTYFQMNYATGKWQRVRKYREKDT